MKKAYSKCDKTFHTEHAKNCSEKKNFHANLRQFDEFCKKRLHRDIATEVDIVIARFEDICPARRPCF